MVPRHQVVSIYPWFKIHPGKVPAFKALIPRFIDYARRDVGCLFFDFTLNGDIAHCREAYHGAEAALAHIRSAGPVLTEAFKISDSLRFELHGSAAELDKMREPLKNMSVEWFVLEAALEP